MTSTPYCCKKSSCGFTACLRFSGTRAFNVGSGSPKTVGEMATALAEAIGGPTPIVTGAFRLGDVRHITADSSRLRDELGWRPEVAFRDGMAELTRSDA